MRTKQFLVTTDADEVIDQLQSAASSDSIRIEELDSKRIAAILGRAGGEKTSERKAQSSRLNGLKGGRPKKSEK